MSDNFEKLQNRAAKEITNAVISATAGVALGATVGQIAVSGIKNINDGKILRGCAKISGAVMLGIPATIRQFLIVKRDLNRSSKDIMDTASKLATKDPEMMEKIRAYRATNEPMRAQQEGRSKFDGVSRMHHRRHQRDTSGLEDGSAVLDFYSGPLGTIIDSTARMITESVTPDELLDGILRRIPEKTWEVSLTGNHLRQSTEAIANKEYMNDLTSKIHWSYVARMLTAFMTGSRWIIASGELLDYGSATMRPRIWFTDSYLEAMRTVTPGEDSTDIVEMVHTISNYLCGPDNGRMFLLTKTKKSPSHTGFTLSLYEFDRETLRRTAVSAIMVDAMKRIDAYWKSGKAAKCDMTGDKADSETKEETEAEPENADTDNSSDE